MERSGKASDGADGFDAFMRARATGLLRYGYVLTGSQHDAADLVQEALARVELPQPPVGGELIAGALGMLGRALQTKPVARRQRRSSSGWCSRRPRPRCATRRSTA